MRGAAWKPRRCSRERAHERGHLDARTEAGRAPAGFRPDVHACPPCASMAPRSRWTDGAPRRCRTAVGDPTAARSTDLRPGPDLDGELAVDAFREASFPHRRGSPIVALRRAGSAVTWRPVPGGLPSRSTPARTTLLDEKPGFLARRVPRL